MRNLLFIDPVPLSVSNFIRLVVLNRRDDYPCPLGGGVLRCILVFR